MDKIVFQAILQSLKKLQGGDVRVVLEVSKIEGLKALIIPEETNLEIVITPKEKRDSTVD